MFMLLLMVYAGAGPGPGLPFDMQKRNQWQRKCKQKIQYYTGEKRFTGTETEDTHIKYTT